VERALGGGAIDIDEEGTIYYTQPTPYEIRTFAADGSLTMAVTRENDFMSKAKVVTRDDGSMTIDLPPASYSIVVFPDGKFINCVQLPARGESPITSIVDLFDSQGRLLATTRLGNVVPKCRDGSGRLYVIDNQEFPSVKRCRYSYARSP
jgi:hypothetical protein